MLVLGRDNEVALWMGDRLGCRFSPPFTCIGVARAGELVAGALFNNWKPPHNIEITFATTTPRWATRQTIRAILSYPFVQLRCHRITAVTEATNQPARAFLCRFGFVEEGRHPDMFDSGDAISYGLLRRNALKWLEEIPDEQSAIAATPR